MEINSPKNTPNTTDIIAVYQIIGGIAGLVFQILTISNFYDITLILIFFFVLAILLYSFSIYCGIMLLLNKPPGIRWTLINQYLQLLSFTFLGYGFEYISGVSFSVGVNFSTSVDVKFYSGISTWHILLNGSEEIKEFNLNLIALFLILLIERIRKKEQSSYDEVKELGK